MCKHSLRILALLLVLASARGVTLADVTWQGQPFSVALPHMTSAAQACTNSVNLTLSHTVTCTIGISVVQAGDQSLKLNGQTLATAYKLTGAALQDGDSAWVNADDFLLRTYHIPGTGPLDILTLSVRGTPSSPGAPDAGTYTASLVVTVTW